MHRSYQASSVLYLTKHYPHLVPISIYHVYPSLYIFHITGCHVLVTNPCSLLRMLEEELTRLNRCCHLVIEEASVTLDKFKEEVAKITAMFMKGKRSERQVIW